MATPKRKFYLTFFWTDESVMQQDFRTKVSGRMLEWANNFYGNYGFELDVFPQLSKSPVPLANRFFLRKTDGIMPDPDFDRTGVDEDQEREEAPVEKNMINLKAELASLRRERSLKDKEYDALREKRNMLYNAYDNEPDRQARDVIYAKLKEVHRQSDALYIQLEAIGKQITKKDIELDEGRVKLREIQEKYDQIRKSAETEIPLRIALGLKYLDKTMTDDRLCVVFCRFVSRAFSMRGRPGKTFGQTFPMTANVTASGYFLWPRPFIIIDINVFNPITLAHEIVHATGNSHPLPVKVVKSLEYLKVRPERVEGSIINRIITAYNLKLGPLKQEVPGGLFDGPPNSIMNYNALLIGTDEIILTNEDKAWFEYAFFVEKLPAP